MPTPDFILQLRDRIGHTPLWLVGTTAVVVDPSTSSGHRGDRLLLVKRADTGEWTPVAGIVEPGEHSADAAEREVWEEARVRAVVEKLAAVGVTREYEYPNGDRTRFTDHTYRLRYVSGEPSVGDDESTDVGWFPLDALPEIPERYLDRIRRALAPGTETILVRDAEG
ncbi:NUDIX hydrolase [Amnibacterium setariae]|uniref:NUDIX domain-containing protein n=1 Tax=Amnibacterium setariae TaxID=2306585 RepID=A0A3A1TVD3_9MICO|nr:NUDIX domain-containing protein [Amnibacterium setariae]RIX28192.1 NUDIX domain-containing protein [Amnibacterium setariae]